mmetsp:Transcript_52509/g.169412  ORF Transcript_52509/g.169412 Transcript_52509/m.169412 type:complete len:523 (-) Transcript_52509:481-2049(-)
MMLRTFCTVRPLLRHAGMHGALVVRAGHLRSCGGSGVGTSHDTGAATKEDPPQNNGIGFEGSIDARTSRAAEPPAGDGGTTLTKVQKAALGGVGAVLAAGGAGGWAWLHWPLVSSSGACALAGAAGVAMLAIAQRGGLPQGSQKTKLPKRLLELKLLNEDVLLKGDMEELDKLGARRKWPSAVQLAFASADKLALEKRQKIREAQAEKLLASVKDELASGATGKEVRQRLRPRLFVFDFSVGQGPAAARPQSTKSQLEMLSSSIAFILSIASKHDEALLRLSSPGGAVAPYGLAAAQLHRLRDAGVRLTICVDTVAASGGYMMACVADHLVAAPFAMVGSIGVIAGVPNFHKLLERSEVEFLQVTAGKYKRTVNVLTPNTEEGLAKFKEDIDIIHEAFKEHIKQCRPALDVDEVATGEVWLGRAALEKGLIDEVGVGEAVLRRKAQEGFDVFELSLAKEKRQGLAKLLEGLGSGGAGAAQVFAHSLGESLRSVWGRALGQAGAPLEPRLEAVQFRGKPDSTR